jgi:ribosomal protein S18 acetylase RimI-like enzyme
MDSLTPRPPIATSGPRLSLREAGRDDQAALQACLDGAPGYHELTEGGPAAPDAAAALLDEAEVDPSRRVLLLLPHRGPAVGLLDLWLDQPEPGTAHVGLLLIREAAQAQGWGAAATALLEQALRAAGFTLLRLSVGDENPGALAFWERLGFAPVGRLDGGVTVLEKLLG